MKQRIFSIFLVLCMIVSMLPVPALAAEAVCGQELHAHDGECYSPKLDCGETAHVHGTECDQVSKTLTCTLPASHTHGESCGGNEDGTPACGKIQAHVHSADCADCGYETACDHASDSCYNITTSRVCGLDEHAHEDGCYSETETVLTCGKVEHAHEDDCYPPECDCETLCEADAMNADCDICGAEGTKPESCKHYVAPATEAEKTCGCDTACEADAMNAGCDICGAEGAKPEGCRHYVAPTTEAEKTCGCDTACKADAMNADCDICGAEGAKPESCRHYVAPTPVCDCGTLCEAGAMNGDCDICGAEGAAPEGCKHYVPPTCTCSIRCGETLNADCDICGAEGARAEECKGPTQACLDALALLAALPRAEEVTEDITESVHKKWTAQAQEALEAVRGLSMEEIASLETHADFVNATALWSALEKVTPVPAVDHIHDDGTAFTPITDDMTELTEGSYYLDGDVNMKKGLTVTGEVTLCLNGNTLDLGNYTITNNHILTICDCGSGGKIVSRLDSSAHYPNAHCTVSNNGALNIVSGSVINDSVRLGYSSTAYGVENLAGSRFVMTGGTVSGPIGIYQHGADYCEVSGSSRVIGIKTYAVSVSAGKTLTLKGTNGAGGITISGNTADISVSTNGLNAAGYVGASPIELASGAAEGKTLVTNASSLKDFHLYQNLTETLEEREAASGSGKDLYITSKHTHADGEEFATKLTADTVKLESGTYYLDGPVTWNGKEDYLRANKNVTLCLNGQTLDLGSKYISCGGGTLTICDCRGGGKITSAKGGGTIQNNNTLIINSGTIHNSVGTAITCDYDNSKLYINGGTVEGSRYGIFLDKSSATAEITDGKVRGSDVGIYLYGFYANLQVSGGEVTGTSADGSCGIYSISTNTTRISGGTVSGYNGVYSLYGGSIYISGTANIIGTANGILNAGTVIMSGGNVTSTAGIPINNDKACDSIDYASIIGGTITGPVGVQMSAGGLYLSGKPTFQVTGPIVRQEGGSIYAHHHLSSNKTPYSGDPVTVEVTNFYEGKVVVYSVTDENQGSFSLANTDTDLVLGRGTGENENNLIIMGSHDHNWDEDHWASDADGHWHPCTADGCSVSDFSGVAGSGYAAHTAPDDDGDCTTAVTCSICQYVFTAAEAAHDLTKTEANDAGCTAPGNSAYWSCEVCGLHFSDDQGKNKIQEDSWIIPASGHDFENGLWVADDENHHWKQCKNCGEEDTKNKAPHAYTGWKKTDEETHTGTCECGRTQAEAHTEQSASTCHTQAVCAVCGTGYGELDAANHTLTYAANDNTITETCTNGCGHTAAVKLTVPTDAVYSKDISHEASAVYDEGWLGAREKPVHSDSKNTGISPVKAGDYTASLTLEEQTVTAAYTIAKAQQPYNAITMDSAVTFPNAPVITEEAVQEKAEISYRIVTGENSSSWDVATVEEDGTIKLLREGTFYVEALLEETENYQQSKITMICTAGSGTLTVTPGEGYEGTYDGRPHTITPPVCEDAVIRYAQGKTQPDTIDSETLPRFTDVGEYTVWYQITRAGYITVTGSLDVSIIPKILTYEDFTAPTTGITYTGTQIKPAVTPREGLREGTDYTVSYGENIHRATGGTITVTGVGNYSGVVGFAFAIDPLPLKAPDADGIIITQNAPGELTVTWPEVANASGYTVFLYKDGGAKASEIEAVAIGCTYEGLTEGYYQAKIIARGEGNYTHSPASGFPPKVHLRTITWKDGDGKTLLKQILMDGISPAYSGDTPTKQPGTDRTYTFSGSWSPEIAPVTKNVTYTARFDASFNAPEADDGSFSIDYEQETITVAQGYEVSTSPDFTGTVLEDGASISDYLGKTLYIRREAQTAPEVAPSAAQPIPLEARPQAPGSGSYTIDYAEETAQAEGDHEISLDGETWGKGPMAVTPGGKVYVRKASDGDKPAGEILTETLASRPATPAAPTLDSKTDTVLNVKTVSGLEYSLDGETWQESGRFTGLTEDTAYTVVTRAAATETTFASEISPALTVSTKKPAPKAPQLTIDAVTDTTVTVTPVEGAEYSKDGGVTWQDSNVFEQLTPETRYMFAIRIQETQDTVAGRAVAEYQYTAPAAPASGDGYTIDYENERASAQTGYEISLDGETWGKGPLDIEPGKTVQVRKKAVDGKPAGMILTDTLAARPAAPTLTDITVTGESVANKGDGKITGITDKMEYRITPKDGAAGRWTDGDGDDLTDLAAGTKVEIRIKAVTGETPAFAGEILEITIQASTVQLTVTFVSAQGTPPADQKVNYGAAPAKPADLTATGYTFGGWYADSGFETEFDFAVQILTDTTVYVKWTVNRYTITFQNTGDKPIDPITQDYGTPVTAPGDPVRIGYFFDGWDKPIPVTMPAENLTITAQWDTVGYKIIEGAKQRVYKGNSATFVSDAPYDKFVAVLVDDVVIGSDACTVVSGSTKVILKAAYIRNLTNGEHTLTVLSEDGWASTTFTVKTRIYYDSPRTGDTTNTGLWITLAIVGTVGLTASILGKKYLKKRK